MLGHILSITHGSRPPTGRRLLSCVALHPPAVYMQARHMPCRAPQFSSAQHTLWFSPCTHAHAPRTNVVFDNPAHCAPIRSDRSHPMNKPVARSAPCVPHVPHCKLTPPGVFRSACLRSRGGSLSLPGLAPFPHAHLSSRVACVASACPPPSTSPGHVSCGPPEPVASCASGPSVAPPPGSFAAPQAPL